MFIAELEHPRFTEFDLSTLRTGIMAGSPCPVEVMKKVQSDMHMAEVTVCYGMTETSPVSFQTAPDDPVDKRVATVGRIHPHVEAKVIDPDNGRIVPRGTPGELCTRGYLVMLGYWKFVDYFPMTVTGKVQKFKMREASVAELGLETAERIETA
jgi:fatty-acyl-CoA synthase